MEFAKPRSAQQDDYMRAYMDGYNAAKREAKETPYIDRKALIERYDGKIGDAKAYEIMRAVRHFCNGGKLNHDGLILRSELEYWEQEVDKQYKARL